MAFGSEGGPPAQEPECHTNPTIRLKRRDREVLILDDFPNANVAAVKAAKPTASTAAFAHWSECGTR